jgi:hypothetical protein
MQSRLPGALILVFAMAALMRADQPAGTDIEHNRVQLEKWKKDSAHYARLRRNWREFESLPPEQQAGLRKLDEDLHSDDAATSGRLLRLLERYADWLQQLPEDDRQAVLNAHSNRERLMAIKRIREREWVKRLPETTQAELKRLPPASRAAREVELHLNEAELRSRWDLGLKYANEFNRLKKWDAEKPGKLAEDIKVFIKNSLEPMLSQAEKDRLAANNNWPLFEITFAELAVEKHPIRLPGPVTGPKHFDELPEKVRTEFKGLGKAKRNPAVAAKEGKWPDYAIGVTAFAAQQKRAMPVQLGPCKPGEFSPAIQAFIEKELVPKLSAKEKEELKREEGSWPAYPDKLWRLAEKHVGPVPGMKPPGPQDVWKALSRARATSGRGSLPDVSESTLTEFAKNELTAEERAALPLLNSTNPLARDEWKRAYFMLHPEELKKGR